MLWIMNSDPPTPARTCLESGGGQNRWACIKSPSTKKHGVYRHVTRNTGPFSVEESTTGKTASLCNDIKQYDIDSFSFQEHGLNLKRLP